MAAGRLKAELAEIQAEAAAAVKDEHDQLMAMKAELEEARAMMSEREQLTAMRAELAEAKGAEEAVVAPLAASMRATADEQLQVVVAEAQVMKAQLDEAVAMQGQAEDHAQAELAEARLMKAVLLELTEPRATMAEVAEMQPALAQAQAEVAVVKDVQHDLEEATSAEMARRIEAEVVPRLSSPRSRPRWWQLKPPRRRILRRPLRKPASKGREAMGV